MKHRVMSFVKDPHAALLRLVPLAWICDLATSHMQGSERDLRASRQGLLSTRLCIISGDELPWGQPWADRHQHMSLFTMTLAEEASDCLCKHSATLDKSWLTRA